MYMECIHPEMKKKVHQWQADCRRRGTNFWQEIKNPEAWRRMELAYEKSLDDYYLIHLLVFGKTPLTFWQDLKFFLMGLHRLLP